VVPDAGDAGDRAEQELGDEAGETTGASPTGGHPPDGDGLGTLGEDLAAADDPVWLHALATAVLTGGPQADELVDNDGHLEARRPTATVVGSGTPGTPVPEVEPSSCEDEGATTIAVTAAMELVVVRVVGTELNAENTLVGRWDGGGPSVLAGIRPR